MSEHYDPDVFGTFEPERPPAEAIWDYCTNAIEANNKFLIHHTDLRLGNNPAYFTYRDKLMSENNAYANVIDYIREGYNRQKEREENDL